MAWSDEAREAALMARRLHAKPKQSDMQDWKRVSSRNVAKLSTDQAKEILGRIHKQGSTMYHEDIRKLTGGYNSQSINFEVIRKLGIKAGIIKNRR